MKSKNQFDVVILGAGIAGGLLGTILSKEGARVLLIDAGVHPRFAIGESTVRHTLRMLKIAADQYQIPELRMVSTTKNIHEHVTSACGEKRNFGFIYHRQSQMHQPQEATQLVIPPFLEGYEAHLYRQDIDAFLFQAAVHYGTVARQGLRITQIDIDEEGAWLQAVTGETFSADYVVDASGFRSPLAEKFALRDDPCRAKTHSRCLFTHMIDVTPYEECVNHVHRTPEPWSSGTCHHLFDGGWVWVIPFNNRQNSTNPLVSVGLQLDSRKYPKPDNMTPEEEWQAFLLQFPSIAIQFKNAKTIRPWVSTDRLQYTSRQTVGDRWALVAHAAGNIDALFSRGLANTMESVLALAPLLLKAIESRDFSAKQFEYMELLTQNMIKYNDLLVYGAYISFRDFDLWNAWFRIWALGVGLGDFRLAGIYRRWLKTRDESILPNAEPPMGLFCSNHLGFKRVFEDALGLLEAVDQGDMEPAKAAEQILTLIKAADFVSPALGLSDPSNRYLNAGRPTVALRSALWAMTSAPPEIRAHFSGVLGGLFGTGKKKVNA